MAMVMATCSRIARSSLEIPAVSLPCVEVIFDATLAFSLLSSPPLVKIDLSYTHAQTLSKQRSDPLRTLSSSACETAAARHTQNSNTQRRNNYCRPSIITLRATRVHLLY